MGLKMNQLYDYNKFNKFCYFFAFVTKTGFYYSDW